MLNILRNCQIIFQVVVPFSIPLSSIWEFQLLHIIYLFLNLAVLGLRFCARAFSSCGKGDHSSSRCAGLSLSWPLPLRSTGSRCAGSVVVAHGPSCSAACGIFPDQGSNPCPLHWQADSQPLCHQGSPTLLTIVGMISLFNFAVHLKLLFWQCQEACGILVPPPGIKLGPSSESTKP